jgi:toxin ParE1/3/4
MPVILRTPASRTDIVEILLHLRRHSRRAARSLHAAIDETLRLLAEYPGAGKSRDELAPRLRSLPVRRYRQYMIYYRPIADGIEVIRVIHGAREVRNLRE